MKKYCAYIVVLGVGMLAGVNAIGQPSPPLPPLPSVIVPFGAPPVVIVSQTQIAEHLNLTNLALPEHYVVRTPAGNIPSSTWNTSAGARLREVPVQIGTAATSLGNVRNPALSNCVAAYFAAGGVEWFEVSNTGEVEMAWVGQTQHQRYLELSRLRLLNGSIDGDTDPWTVKYVLTQGDKTQPWYALNAQRLGLLQIWNTQ